MSISLYFIIIPTISASKHKTHHIYIVFKKKSAKLKLADSLFMKTISVFKMSIITVSTEPNSWTKRQIESLSVKSCTL